MARAVTTLLLLFGFILLGVMYVRLGNLSRAPASGIVDARGQEHVAVVLTDRGFEPSSLRISRGTEVRFSTTRENKFWPASNPHPTHEIHGAFDPRKPIGPKESWSFVFNEPGEWGFHDHIRSYFIGTIYVD